MPEAQYRGMLRGFLHVYDMKLERKHASKAASYDRKLEKRNLLNFWQDTITEK